MWEQNVTQYDRFQEGQVLAKLLTLGWTLHFASLCYEMGFLKRFISLYLDPAGFIAIGPSLHQLSSQRAKAIRKQWERNTTVFTFLIALAWCPDFLWNLLWGWLLKTQEWLTKEWRVSLSGRGFAHTLAWQWSKLITWLAVPVPAVTSPLKIFPWIPCETQQWVGVGKPEMSQGQDEQQFGTNSRDTGKWRNYYEVLPWPQSRYFYVLQGYPLTDCEKRERKPWVSAFSWISLRSCFIVSNSSVWLLVSIRLFTNFRQVFPAQIMPGVWQ